jgi:type I restriction enzyme S subunit
LARITPCLENGKTGYVQNLPEDTVGWGSTEFIVLRTKPAIPSAVSYLIARDDEFRRHVIQSMTGTSGRQRANADAVARYPAAVPDGDELWQAFGTILDPIFEQIASSERESRTLAETRDTLLPKLMSGKIRVRDTKAFAA